MEKFKKLFTAFVTSVALMFAFTSCDKEETYSIECTKCETNLVNVNTGASMESELLSMAKKGDVTFEAESKSDAKKQFDEYCSTFKSSLKSQISLPSDSYLKFTFELKSDGKKIESKTLSF